MYPKKRLVRNQVPISTNDAFLLSEFSRGRQQAFEQIFHEFHSAVCYYAYQFVDDKEVAKDIASETFVKVWHHREGFKSMDNLKSFLYLCTKNTCLNYIKRTKLFEEYSKSVAYDQDTAEMDDVSMKRIFDAEVLRELNKAIESLPAQCRRVIRMAFTGMKTDEIAAQLGLSHQTIRNTRNRAVTLLKKQMQPGTWVLVSVMLLEFSQN